MKPYKSLLLLAIIIPILAQAKDTVRVSHKFADKVVHSFSIQCNNCLQPKGHFDYHCDPSLGYQPTLAYGREWTMGYQLTTKSGVGFGIDFAEGVFDMGFLEKNPSSVYNNIPFSFYRLFPFSYINPLECDYLKVRLKATYLQIISNRLFINYMMGASFPYYFPTDITANSLSGAYMIISTDGCTRNWVPDLSFGIDFLLHTKRNPRNNFVIGINANVGFVPRYQGFFSLQEPYQNRDCDISYSSSFLGIHCGYAFESFPKTFFPRKYRKEMQCSTFDFTHPVHACAIELNNGLAVGGKTIHPNGLIHPIVGKTYSPGLSLKYSCLLKKGWGFSIAIPVGLFWRSETISLFGVVPSDTIWANGSVGYGQSGNQSVYLHPYAGLSLRADYLKEIHRNMYLQCELGISIYPLIADGEFGTVYYDENGNPVDVCDYFVDYIGDQRTAIDYDQLVPFAYEWARFNEKSYWIPNLSGAVNFLVHGKNPSHNFVFGLNFNVDFTKRVTIDYQTVPTFPDKYKSSGQFVFNMTTIGLHVGYQFMTGKKEAKRP